MPVVASFDGIKIEFYFDEHPPPHFHARYAEYVAQFHLETLTVLKGSLPRVQERMVREWASTRREALRAAWEICAGDGNPGKIE